jgi:hypothetical protein
MTRRYLNGFNARAGLYAILPINYAIAPGVYEGFRDERWTRT